MVSMTMIVRKDDIADQRDNNEEWCDDNDNSNFGGDDSFLYHDSVLYHA